MQQANQITMWRDSAVLSQYPLSTLAIEWLMNADSLTQRLYALPIQSEIQFQLLTSEWQHPLIEEQSFLQSACLGRSFLRHILWSRCHMPWIIGRVLIPAETLEVNQGALSRIGERPIGEILFADKNLRRSAFEFSLLEQQHPYCKTLHDVGEKSLQAIWARRSRIYYHESSLLVVELFLPNFFTYLHSIAI